MSLAKLVLALLFFVLALYFLLKDQDAKAQICTLLAIFCALAPVP